MTSSQVLHGLAKFMRDMFTGRDNITYDLGRVIWAIGSIWYMSLGTMAVVFNHQDFNFIDAGTGLGLVLAGGGAALWAKKATEGDQKE